LTSLRYLRNRIEIRKISEEFGRLCVVGPGSIEFAAKTTQVDSLTVHLDEGTEAPLRPAEKDPFVLTRSWAALRAAVEVILLACHPPQVTPPAIQSIPVCVVDDLPRLSVRDEPVQVNEVAARRHVLPAGGVELPVRCLHR